RQEDARGRYIEFCKASFPYHLDLKGLKIVVDCAHGATYQVAPAVFRELGAEVVAVCCEPDGMNINADCGSTHPQNLQAAVLINKADLGIAFDGDGDRIIMVDHTGSVVDGDEIIVMIARARQQEGINVGGVVGTVMSNMGMEVAIKNMGLEFVRAKVGDRYVMSALAKRGWMLGGEASGHIVCLDKTSTGDAIIAALQVLAAVVQSQQSLQELRQGMAKFPQQLINVKIAQKSDPMQHEVVVAAVKEAEAVLGERGRVLLRASGTEPVIRVMVEGENQQQITRICQSLADQVQKALG
ncbi:MAG: phosphoglucosamine mutase, partial [Pseudomonadales bacterium]|nr:phosphoglucosamine mutase [Pseudomonadales bacterium]